MDSPYEPQCLETLLHKEEMSSTSPFPKIAYQTVQLKVQNGLLRGVLGNLQEVLFGTKLSVLFPAIILALVANFCNFGGPWIFALSLIGLTPLAERVSFLTEQIAFYTGPAVAGLLNATCGNAPELIISLFALREAKLEVIKWSLLGSVVSNLLLVLGTALFCGGVANLREGQKFDTKQADMNSRLLLLGLVCHTLPLMFRYSVSNGVQTANQTLQLSRASSIVMLLAYFTFLFFQLKTHQPIPTAHEEQCSNDDEDLASTEEAVIGFPSAFAWLLFMTFFISLLSENIVGTIEEASASWGISVSFISIILLPIVGNVPEHAGATIFAFRNKLDITLGVSLGSAAQVSMFVVPLSVLVAWIVGRPLNLDFELLETGSLFIAVLLVTFTLQRGTSNYLKGLVLILCYIVVGTCFFVQPTIHQTNVINISLQSSYGGVLVQATTREGSSYHQKDSFLSHNLHLLHNLVNGLTFSTSAKSRENFPTPLHVLPVCTRSSINRTIVLPSS